jgi:DNA-binding MltR family transcriptional regulator
MALKFDKAGEQELLLLFLNQLDKESDRGCALVAAGYLEDQLKKVLQARMVKHTGPAEEIFEGHEALATFSAKIKVAYLLGIVSHEVYSDLNRIRDIRNAFAHNLEIDSFAHASVVEKCALLENVQEEWLPSDKHSPARKNFTRCAMAFESILESCLVQSQQPKAVRQKELDTLKYWNDILSI